MFLLNQCALIIHSQFMFNLIIAELKSSYRAEMFQVINDLLLLLFINDYGLCFYLNNSLILFRSPGHIILMQQAYF